MAKFNGDLFLLYLDTNDDGTVDDPIGESTSVTVDITHNTSDATSKDSSGWEEFISSNRSVSYSVDGFVDFSQTLGAKELIDLIVNRTKFKVAAKVPTASTTTGDVVIEQDAYLTSYSIEAGQGETVTYSLECQGTGTATVTEVS